MRCGNVKWSVSYVDYLAGSWALSFGELPKGSRMDSGSMDMNTSNLPLD